MSIRTAASRTRSVTSIVAGVLAAIFAASASAQPVTITIDPSKVTHELTPYMTGVCLEDVNHEIYGGLYSQMIYGESFQESPTQGIKEFSAFDGRWSVADGVLRGSASSGGKLVHTKVSMLSTIRVEIRFPDRNPGNAGLIVDVENPTSGADSFDGYEISLDPTAKIVRLARHDHDYHLIRDVPCELETERWIMVSVGLRANKLSVYIDGKQVIEHELKKHPSPKFGLRTWQRDAEFRSLMYGYEDWVTNLPFEVSSEGSVSGMWSTFSRDRGTGTASIEQYKPLIGTHFQGIASTGEGTFGIANRGLNKQGIGFVAGRKLNGYLWARSALRGSLAVSLASANGEKVYASTSIPVNSLEWTRYDFTLTPDTDDPNGRFEIGVGSHWGAGLAHVWLSPSPEHCFAGLPVRADVAAAMKAQSPKVIRYGGSMINSGQYRWKKMIGPRDRRSPYACVWDPHATNGWAIPDFLNFAEAMGVLAIPAFNIDESPQDMVDFLEYATGDASTPYGAKRAADGHPAPYNLTHLQLGNEERVDNNYFRRFEPLARALWARNPKLILTVGDFCYTKPITDPFNFDGADSGIHTLAAHQDILNLAKELSTEVWFDLHIWSERPTPMDGVRPWKTYIDQITKLGQGIKHKVVIYELNANSHTQHRALANAQILMELQRDGRVPVVITANALQVDGQNDDGWNQGLIFMNTTKVWAQPPSLLWQMVSTSTHPNVAATSLSTGAGAFDALATFSADGKSLSVQVLNLGDTPRPIDVGLKGRSLDFALIRAETLAAPLDASNTADAPESVKIRPLGDKIPLEVPAHSFTILQYKLP